MQISNQEIVKRLTGGKFTQKDVNRLNLNLSKKKYNKKDVLKGLNVELEHKDVTKGDLKKTYKIARAHLNENPNYYDYLEVLENPKNYSLLMAMRGEGIKDYINNKLGILQHKYKKVKDIIKSGEIHAPLIMPDGSIKRASFMGPGTNILDRLRDPRPEYSEPVTLSDKTAKAHDIRYSLASTQDDIANADLIMVNKLKELKRDNKDSNFNIQMGMKPIQAKMFLEKYGILKPGALVPFGEKMKPEDDKLMRETLKRLELEGYGYGGCHSCGGEINLIMQKNQQSLTEQVKDSLELISNDTNKGQIFGSYVYRSQYYPSDIDYYEILDTTPSKEKDIYKTTVKTLQDIVKDIHKRQNIYFGEVKAGFDNRYNIDPLDTHNFMNKIHNLMMNGLFKQDEYNYINQLYESYRLYGDMDAFDEVTEIMRLKKTLRWDEKEILKGYKILAGSKKISLENAMRGLTPIKIDIWAPINGRYIEITNFFFLVVYDKDTKNIKLLNSETVDYVKGILKQVEKYSSKLFFNPFKMAKRMWGIARELKYDTLLNLLTPLFQGSIAKINQIVAEIETIILMYENIKNTPDTVLDKQIDEFKARLSYIYDIDLEDDLIYTMIDDILRIDNKPNRIQILTDLKKYLKDIVNKYSVEYLKDKSLFPVPSFIYNLVSPDYEHEGPMNLPLFQKVFGDK
jgi:hypothetical protein